MELCAQTPCADIIEASYGGNADDIAYDIVPADGTNFYLVGNTYSFGPGNGDILVIKMDISKKIIWSRVFGGNEKDLCRKASRAANGDLLITGMTTSGYPLSGILCMRVSTTGTLLWNRAFALGSPYGDLGSEIIETSDGEYAVSGIINVAGAVADGIVLKLDGTGGLVWSKRFAAALGEDGSCIVEAGGKLVTTFDLEKRSGNDYSSVITELNLATGAVLASKEIISASKGMFRPQLFNDGSGGYWLSGHFIYGSNYSQMEQVILKLSASYSILKSFRISGNSFKTNPYTGFIPMSDGGFITCASEPISGVGKGHIYRIDANGKVIFSKRFGKAGKTNLNGVTFLGGKVIAAGSYLGSASQDFYVTTFNPDGSGAGTCNTDSSIIGVVNQSFSITDFTWPSVVDQSFSNTQSTLATMLPVVPSNVICQDLSAQKFDFSYKQDNCNPLIFKFFVSGNPNSVNWKFGDGATVSTEFTPVHAFPASGNFKVSLQAINSCATAMEKLVHVGVSSDKIILTNDTTVCPGSILKLRAKSANSYCWSPATYLDDPNIANPTSSPANDIIYHLLSKTVGDNLVRNGSFENGNADFTSEYLYNNSSGFNEGVYTVSNSVTAWHPGMASCNTDHSSGSGKMLLVNGSRDAGVKVWTQTIKVLPGTSYDFGCWLQHITFLNPAKLQFSINGIQLGEIFNASTTSCLWERFNIEWNSGSDTAAVISIVNMNTEFSGNDFAIDDISFAPITVKSDSISIKLDNAKVKASNDTTICVSSKLQLTAGGVDKYQWAPQTGLTNSAIANPQATINAAISYIVTGTSKLGCSSKDTVNIKLGGSLPVKVSPKDTTICASANVRLTASGGNTYNWNTAAAGLDKYVVANPLAAPSNTTTYTVKVTDGNGCEGIDSAIVRIAPPILLQVSRDTNICNGDKLRLTATGGKTYQWQPAASLSNPILSSPVASPIADTRYKVTAFDAWGCNVSDSLNVAVLAKPTLVTSNDTSVCSRDTIVLQVSGAMVYSWRSNPYLTGGSTANPKVSPLQTSFFYVKGVGQNGCFANDSIKVTALGLPAITLTGDTAVCKNADFLLHASGGSQYQWTGSAMLTAKTSPDIVIKPSSAAMYYLKVTDANGCSNQDSVFVAIRPDPVFGVSASKLSICQGETIQLSAFGGDSYQWTPALAISNDASSDPNVSPKFTTDYLVTVSESTCGNSQSFQVQVLVQETIPAFVTKSNDLTCSMRTTQLTTSGGVQYAWSPGKYLSDSTIANPIANPQEDQVYKVSVTQLTGCVATAEIKVNVLKNNDFRLYQLPNAFTPNGDGRNDCFGISKWGNVNVVYFNVYNRWGQLMFTGSNTSTCWDGRFNGQQLPSGNYVYKLRVETFCGVVERQGNVILIR